MYEWLALAHAQRGEWGRAAHLCDEALGHFEVYGPAWCAVRCCAHRAIIEIAQGELAEADGFLARGRALEDGSGPGPHRGAMRLAEAFATRCAAALDGAADEQEPLTASAMAHHDVMVVAAIADRFLAEKIGDRRDVLEVCTPEARWFEWNGEEVDLTSRDAPRRILTRLVEHRLDRPGEALSKEQIVEAGWPDEVLHPQAAVSRVYTAIRQLRGFGLEDVLLTQDGGYLLDPTVAVVRH